MSCNQNMDVPLESLPKQKPTQRFYLRIQNVVIENARSFSTPRQQLKSMENNRQLEIFGR